MPPLRIHLEIDPLGLRHWVALLAVVLVLVAVCGLSLVARGEIGPPARIESLSRGPHDDRAHVMEVLSRDVGETDLFVVGTSLAREALWAGEILGRSLGERTGLPIRVTDLVASDLSFLEALFLLHRAALRPGQTVLLSVSPTSFAQDDVDHRRLRDGLFLMSPLGFAQAFEKELPELRSWLAFSERTASLIATARSLLHRSIHDRLGNWARRHLYGEPPWRRHRYDALLEQDAAAVERRRHEMSAVRERMDAWWGSHPRRARQLEVLLTHVRARGCRAYLFEAPRAKGDVDEVFGPWWRTYIDLVARIATESGVECVDLNRFVPLGPDDFARGRHLGPDGRARWSRALVAWLAQRIGEG